MPRSAPATIKDIKPPYGYGEIYSGPGGYPRLYATNGRPTLNNSSSFETEFSTQPMLSNLSVVDDDPRLKILRTNNPDQL